MNTEVKTDPLPTSVNAMLDKHLLRKALACYAESLKAPEIDGLDRHFLTKRIEAQLAWLDRQEYAHQLERTGGAHLGEIRNFIQCKFINGSDVTWGSQEELRSSSWRATPWHFEQMASRIAAATLNDLKGKA